MNFRQNCIKLLVFLGILLVSLQILLTSNYICTKCDVMCKTLSTALRSKLSCLRRPLSFNLDSFHFIKTVDQNTTTPALHSVYSVFLTDTIDKNSTQVTLENGKAVVPTHVGHEGHNGFDLAARAHNVCAAQHIISPGGMNTVHTIPNRRLLYCPMEKIATTFWRRLFYMMVSKDSSKYKQPYDVPIDMALSQTKLFSQTIARAKSGNLLAKSSFSFLFVRNPYSRLLSAFIDKLVPPNPVYWKFLGIKSITQFRSKNNLPKDASRKPTDGHDVTFAEFLKFAVSLEKSGKHIDPHVISINKGCKPCTYQYKYIGRMETFKDDALFILKKLQLNETVEILEESFSDLSVDDAITDSIRSPFSWKRDIIKLISWEKALQRIWLKLQMRGIIETKIKLNILKDQIDGISVNQFIEMARKAHKDSNPAELTRQKDLVKREAFASVPLTDLKAFRDTFKEDFALFGYDPSPTYIFDRDEDAKPPIMFFNYSHLN